MKMQYLKNVVTLSIDKNRCNGCGICLEVCPQNVLKIENKKAVIIDKDSCIECGACKMNCPLEAINVKSGVGCAAAVYNGILNNKETSCSCGSSNNNSGCCT